MAALPPATLEGWYARHQALTMDWAAWRALDGARRREVANEAVALARAAAVPADGGWSAGYRLVGGGADWLLVHFRPTLEELSELELRLRRSALGALLRPAYEFLSVTEAGLYHATAEAARAAEPRSEAFERIIAEHAEAEWRSPHVRSRLFPEVPERMRYVSFYPMTKRRAAQQNWYALPLEERTRLMQEHGLTGRRYAGRVFQVITGAAGLDDWEWGVTLFTEDPLEFKRLVTEMRYDEASAVYGEFGRFFTGIRIEPEEWPALLGVEDEKV